MPKIAVWVGNKHYQATVGDGTWYVDVLLPGGSTVIKAILASATLTRIVVTFPSVTDIAQQAPQKVHVEWPPGAFAKLESIARSTLAPGLPGIEDFPMKVQLRTAVLLREMLEGIDIQFVAESSGAHLIKMLPRRGEGWGYTYGDCGNRDPEGVSDVYVGSFEESMRTELETYWLPMDRSKDSLETRIEDVAWALASTAAHELAHGLGLVACDWMQADPKDDGHNHPNLAFDSVDPLTSRFGAGKHLMDSGLLVLGNLRIGEERTQRGFQRIPRRFSTFNWTYLKLIHPLP